MIDRKYTGFSGDSMWQILCQLKVSLSSDQYFNLNKTAQRGRAGGEAETLNGEKTDKINIANAKLADQRYIFPERMECLSCQAIFHAIDGLSPPLSGTAPNQYRICLQPSR